VGRVVPTNRRQGPSPQPMPPPQAVQGGSLRTWTHGPAAEQHVTLGTNGRPLDATVEVWDGPGNTPVSMRVYGENGRQRPINAAIGGRGGPSTVAVRNTGPMEFPITGDVMPVGHPSAPEPVGRRVSSSARRTASGMTIQGGAERTFRLDWPVSSVQVLLSSEGMPITATIEVLQGPNTNRQGIELYSEDGRGRPVSYVLETPGYGCVIQINNKGPMEFPLTAEVVPLTVNHAVLAYGGQAIIGGDDRSGHGGCYDDWGSDTEGWGDRDTIY
jgi:hypothetical protein